VTIRRVVFWLHLLTGLTAGAVIATMAVTGALLTFEPQIVQWAERDLWRATPPAPDSPRLPLATVVARAQERQAGERATTLSLRPDPRSSVRVGFGRDRALYVNPYSGDVVGAGSRTHDVMHTIEDWHRWLGSRDLGRPFTGACNLAFLGLAVSGLYIWWPRSVESLDRPRHHGSRRAPARPGARLQLAQLDRLLVRAGADHPHAHRRRHVLPVGERSPLSPDRQRTAARRGRRRTGGGPRRPARRCQWRSTRRRATPRRRDEAPRCRRALRARGPADARVDQPHLATAAASWGAVTAFIQEPPTWHPSPRSVLTLDAATAEVVRWEPFKEANMGRTLRLLARVLHTGEIGGVIGQLIVGLASAGGAFLVYTGAALAWRRFRGWIGAGAPRCPRDGSYRSRHHRDVTTTRTARQPETGHHRSEPARAMNPTREALNASAPSLHPPVHVSPTARPAGRAHHGCRPVSRLVHGLRAGTANDARHAGSQPPGTPQEDVQLPAVDVQGQGREYRAPAADLYKLPDLLKDTPQSITVVPQQIMREEAVFNLRDALRNVTGISLAAGEGGGAQGDNLTLRGFSARNDIFIDGVRDIGQYSRDTFNLDSVEVLEGPLLRAVRSRVHRRRHQPGEQGPQPDAELHLQRHRGVGAVLPRLGRSSTSRSTAPRPSGSTRSVRTTTSRGATRRTSRDGAQRRPSPSGSAPRPGSPPATTTWATTTSRTTASRTSSASRPRWTATPTSA
jgi:uncharacterized iron-regulated membrane protein